jgi:hypothetical protein
VIGSTRAIRVFVRAVPTDLRKGFDGLYGLVCHEMGQDPLRGDLYLFMNARRTSAKVLADETSWRMMGTGVAAGASHSGHRHAAAGLPSRARHPELKPPTRTSARLLTQPTFAREGRARMYDGPPESSDSTHSEAVGWRTRREKREGRIDGSNRVFV